MRSGTGRTVAWLAGLAAVGLLAALLVPSQLFLSLASQASIYAIYALGVGMLVRQSGMVSFGHAAFFGLPAYIVAILAANQAVRFELALVLAVGATAAVAFLLGLVIVRVQGIAFGMLTLALGQAAYEASTQLRGLTGGHDGLSVAFPAETFGLSVATFQRPSSLFVMAWLALVATLAVTIAFGRSRLGRLTEAIRDNEERTRFLGYRTLVPRAASFALSAGITAVAGVLFALNNGFISPETVHWTASGSALIMAVLGGTQAAWGPILGAFAFFGMKELVGSYTTHWLGVIGLALVVVAAAFPEGLSGLATSAHRFRRCTRRRVPLAREEGVPHVGA